MEYLYSLLMGLVEGITEFLPISSTGHLILTGELLRFESLVGKEAAEAFEIIIQFGAIVAVVFAYPGRFSKLLKLGDNRGFSGLRGIGLLFVTMVPASLLALLSRRFIHEHLFSSRTVAASMAVGAVWILLVERFPRKAKIEGLDAITWREALSVGLFQCLSLWPGMSRSASTILGGMMSGMERKTATEYSFFAAVPLIAAATGYELYKSYPAMAGHFGMLAVGFAVSFVTAWLSLKFFIHFLARHTLTPFGWYRLAVAGLVFWLLGRG